MNSRMEPAVDGCPGVSPSAKVFVERCGLHGYRQRACQLLPRLPAGWTEAARSGRYHVEAMARILGLSARQLLRQCTAEYSCPMKEALTHCQMAEAVGMLSERGNVKALALVAGFQDVGRFRKRFKDYFGVTPFEFVQRRRYRGQVDARRRETCGVGDEPAQEMGGGGVGKGVDVRFRPLFVGFCPFWRLPRHSNTVVRI